MEYTEAIKSKPVVVVEFYANWCPHCRKMMPVMDQIKELLEGNADIYQLDIDLNEKLADVEEITSTPTFIIYKDGKEVWRESGEMEGQFLLDKIQSFL
ncbi:MAG: thioredoxin family protein [Muribaculaceae bacterium]|nr:thioredoxin family protein [Muribaculaceae bacterium]MDE6753969.1 thioredoxin family protein [Muribaculaceae bacterium]